MSSPVDVAVVGAGPAGVAAAVTAARGGRSVALIDANERTGGQYYRRPVADLDARQGPARHRWAAFERLDQDLSDLIAAGVVNYLPRTYVWNAAPGPPFTLHTRGSDRNPSTATMAARKLVVATGAYDRHVPVPGWDLPGVMSCGGAQALVKGSLVTPGARVVVAGTGPFLLPVATSLLTAGARVLAVIEANSPLMLAGRLGGAAAGWTKLPELGRYIAVLARHRVPYLRRHRVTAVEGAGAVERVVVAKVDGQWAVRPGTERFLSCDTAALGYGFVAQLDLLLQLGCAVHTGADGGLAVRVDAEQRTTVPGVFAAGEPTGVGGAELALIEGLLAGASAAQAEASDARTLRALRRKRARLRRFAAALHAAFPVQRGWVNDLTDDAVICRCEEVRYAKLREAITSLGASDARTAKLLTRTGMGWCQGRICAYPTATICAAFGSNDRGESAAALAAATYRPLVNPVPLAQLAALDEGEPG